MTLLELMMRMKGGGGGPAPSGSLSISENGTFDVTEYAEAVVDVPSGGTDPRFEQYIMHPDGQGLFDVSDMPFTTIREYMFANWAALNELKLPSTVKVIKDGAFSESLNLTLYGRQLPSGVTGQIPENAFYSCHAVDLDSLPAGITVIKRNAFYECSNLTLAALPDGVTSIYDSAFFNCYKLALTALPAALTNIEPNAFQNCRELKITEIPAKVTSIGNYAFAGCTSIPHLDYKPTGNTSQYVLSGCTAMEWLKMRAQTIMYNFATNCTALKKVWISSNCRYFWASSLSNAPFAGCSALTDIYCEASEQPANWGAYFNATGSGTTATVHWGVSEADFDAIIAQQS